MHSSPYSTAPDRAFWSRAVSRGFQASAMLAPDVTLLRKGDRVASAGSCFAANIVPYLERSGFHYVRTEPRHPMVRQLPENLGYDSFSAGYGNIYTARQLLQLLRRSTGAWAPAERVWQEGDAWVDPYRPGLRYRARSLREFDLLQRQHLASVRRMWTEASVFVFTLGLTEAWVSRQDGAVFPACPGTVAGRFDAERHAFHNLTAGETAADLRDFIREARALNPALRLILTVSPVPLVATATGAHVLEATIYSKSALRVAAAEVVAAHADVQYVPAYEIVTGPQAPADFFEPDRRNVSKAAVEVVMAALLARCETGVPAPRPAPAPAVAPEPAGAGMASAIMAAECEEAMADPTLSGAAPVS